VSQFSQENSNFREPLLLGTLLLICFITSMTSQVLHQIQGGGTAKELLDYMFYLLVKQRHMLLVGAGLLTLRDIVIEAMKCFEQIKVVPQQDNLAETCRMLLKHDTATTTDDESLKMQSTSVLFHVVAKKLFTVENRYEM